MSVNALIHKATLDHIKKAFFKVFSNLLHIDTLSELKELVRTEFLGKLCCAPKWCFLYVLKNLVISFSCKQSKMKNHVLNYILLQTLYLASSGSQVVGQNVRGQ